MLQYILNLYDNGILAVPCNHDKPIRPLVEYSHWRETRPSRSEIEAIWAKYPASGVLILCEGIEVIDLDTKNQDFVQDIITDFETEVKALSPGLFEKLTIEKSQSGGRHYFFRTTTPGASCALARRPSNPFEIAVQPKIKYRTLVDYLAHGKLCRTWPTNGYELLQGDFFSIPLINDDERRVLISAALSLNSYYDQPESHTPAQPGARPGDEYNERTTANDIADLLQRHGWRFLRRRGHYIDMNRPGARTNGVDGTINGDQKWFYPWSSSCGFPQEKAYDFFGTYSILEHGGDLARAAKSLAANGYGSQQAPARQSPPSLAPPYPIHEQPAGQQSWADRLEGSKFRFDEEYTADWMLYHKNPYSQNAEETPLAAAGQILAVIGPGKSFKSQVVGAIASSALGRTHETGFRISMPFLRPKIMLFDTEQDRYYFGWSVKRIHWQADINQTIPNFAAYQLFDLAAAERRDAIMQMVEADPDVGLVIIDGILDLVSDYNDPKEAARLSDWLLKLKSLGPMIMMVCHTGETKSLKDQLKPVGAIGSMIVRKAEVMIILEIMNPKEEDEKMRRVKIRPRPGRGRAFKSVEVMSYQKMVYLAGHQIPEHYQKYDGKPAPKPAPVQVEQTPNVSQQIDLAAMRRYGWQIEGKSMSEEEEDEQLFNQFLNESENGTTETKVVLG